MAGLLYRWQFLPEGDGLRIVEVCWWKCDMLPHLFSISLTKSSKVWIQICDLAKMWKVLNQSGPCVQWCWPQLWWGWPVQSPSWASHSSLLGFPDVPNVGHAAADILGNNAGDQGGGGKGGEQHLLAPTDLLAKHWKEWKCWYRITYHRQNKKEEKVSLNFLFKRMLIMPVSVISYTHNLLIVRNVPRTICHNNYSLIVFWGDFTDSLNSNWGNAKKKK